MWFISKRLHRQMLKAKEREIQGLITKVDKLEKYLQEERECSKQVKEKYDSINEKYISEAKSNIKNAQKVVELEKIINKIEYKIKDKRTIRSETTMQIKKLVKDYHTHN